MSTTHDYLTVRAHVLGLALATGIMAAACGGGGDDKPSTEEDAGGTSGDSGTKTDAGSTSDSGTKNDAGASDAGADAAGGEVDTRDKDAGPSDPIVDGSAAPTLAAQNGAAYFDDTIGPRILLKGRDPNGDVKEAVIEFFNKDDAGTLTPTTIDFSPDDDDPAQSSFTVPIPPVPLEAGFFIQLEQTSEFTSKVNTVKITVKDALGNASEQVTLTKKKPDTATSACDPFGFNLCASTSVCASTSATAFACQTISQARNALLGKIPALTPPAVTKVLGSLRVTSFWDPPSGCIQDSQKRRPDSVIKLRLEADAAKVVLSTDNPGTNITDTVLYQLSSLAGDAVACTTGCPTCNDDIQGGTPTRKSKIELTNLKANTDYFIVVDSVPAPANEPGGRDFEVSATVTAQ